MAEAELPVLGPLYLGRGVGEIVPLAQLHCLGGRDVFVFGPKTLLK